MADVEETWIADLRSEMDRQYKMGYADALRHYATALRDCKKFAWNEQVVEIADEALAEMGEGDGG